MARVVAVPVEGALPGPCGSRGGRRFGKTVVCRMVSRVCLIPRSLHLGSCAWRYLGSLHSSSVVWVQMQRRMRLRDQWLHAA